MKQLIKGNYAIAQAAVNAGCDCYFGYPITPQSEIGEYMSKKMPELKRGYVSAESELAAINMVLGACSTGVKAMTSSSSCAVALMQEALSYIASDELPAVLISVMRAGPGLGYIYPSQADYNQATIGGGNGDYKIITLAPSTVQECVDLTYKAFFLAHKYRNPVILLADGLLGQMMAPVEIGKYPYPEISNKDWALEGAKNRQSRAIFSLEPLEENLIKRIDKLFKKYKKIEENEVEFEEYQTQDAELIVVCFGSITRNVKSAVKECRKQGKKVGILRPITLWPFPSKKIEELANKTKKFLVVEMNMGQMLKDVKLAVNGQVRVEFQGKSAGQLIGVEEIVSKIERLIND
ncbi:MAG TPA: 3-methyl-2-oxobutanoate dehydrogenase subunit VorB [Candidatus Gastranaerophilaceae bacterium]|nr:3-methyl-2-oxobutanoate dehydrogenase subunit VorB [Candidatus Gastranaerophilaceae bacterium]HPT42005.1 3-methyl-2-oxobutanoate dehydrogenase subunit VorB [Candidatus Gastranaerophilaceae bacterium]